MNVLEAFKQLEKIYNLVEKKNYTQLTSKSELKKDSWLKFFYTFNDINFPTATGIYIPLVSKDFISAYNIFIEDFGFKEAKILQSKLAKIINTVGINGRPTGCNSEKINGIDHAIYEMKVGFTRSNKPIRVLYFPKQDSDGKRYLVLANLLIHTNKNLSASERNSGKNSYSLANLEK